MGVHGMARAAGSLAMALGLMVVLYYSGIAAYDIRMYAINSYGRVIHEFDPWFNYRATEYLGQQVVEKGWYEGHVEFFHWYDYKVWYPLGRPVGTTIYPGMQMSSVVIWKVLEAIGYNPVDGSGVLSLNDVCCFVPVWFGVSGTVFLAFLAGECAKSYSAAAVAAMIMSVVPAHVMRCHGGGYDNESIALTAMCMTFYCWCRSLRTDPSVDKDAATKDSVIWGVITGFAYIYMVAAWGGYVFVLNMVAIHAATLCCIGRYSSKLHRAYTLFYVIGTFGAMQVPVVGWTPLKSLEQLGGLAVLIGLQWLEFCEIRARRDKLSIWQKFLFRFQTALPLIIAVGLVVMMLMPTGYFAPFSSRIRGLFVKHTRTGNPLVDSVAEHQPASEAAYQQYLLKSYDYYQYGIAVAALHAVLGALPGDNDAASFIVVYATAAYYFSSKMSRLIILLGPIASATAGIALGCLADELIFNATGRLLLPLLGAEEGAAGEEEGEPPKAEGEDGGETDKKTDEKTTKKADKKKAKQPTPVDEMLAALNVPAQSLLVLAAQAKALALKAYDNPGTCIARICIGLYCVQEMVPIAKEFYQQSDGMADGLSQPSIMFKATLRNGQAIIVDDYREAYHWLRDKTPEDSRVMAWWDYGYQITGIGERTTIADGNTWNHEHIATLGRILSAPEQKAHKIAKHLADYVLVWAGGGGDDLAKSPHMARIGNSVYRDICPGDPTCSQFGFYQGGRPTPMMQECLLYKMCLYGQDGIPPLNSSLFKHVFTSRYGKVRIFKVRKTSKKSKEWIADPANRDCDAPGSWYCTGNYPPPLQPLIAKRHNFAQVEDFNRKKDASDERYQEEYHARMSGQKGSSSEDSGGDDRISDLKLKFLGCYASESQLPSDKEYGGSVYGANIRMAKQFAIDMKKQYLAIARSGVDGHNFAFDVPPSGKKVDASECDHGCQDLDNYKCGCSDGACGALQPAPGEDNKRRWAVYELGKSSKKKSKKKGGGDEL